MQSNLAMRIIRPDGFSLKSTKSLSLTEYMETWIESPLGIPRIGGLYIAHKVFSHAKDSGDLSILGCHTSSGLKVVTKAVSATNIPKVLEIQKEVKNNKRLLQSDYIVSMLYYTPPYQGMPPLIHHDQ